MRESDIQVGQTYTNRGKGRTSRKVIAIGPEHAPEFWWGRPERKPAPGASGVLFEIYPGCQRQGWLESFAKWAAKPGN